MYLMFMVDVAQWLDVGSRAKAESIIRLAPAGVRTVIEIGCGTGAVLRALDRLGFAERYWACEPEPTLHAQIPIEEIGRLVAASPSTLDQAFVGQHFDLAILTHVVEHLITPAVVVAEAIRRARHVIIEVPLDDSPGGRTRARIRQFLGHNRMENSAGHVQFFSRRSARDLVRFSGGKILADRGYFPYEAAAVSADRHYRKLVLHLAQIEALGRAYHQHYAMLVEQARIDTWDHHYHKPE
jgi:SAM-dependent methyltransferase